MNDAREKAIRPAKEAGFPQAMRVTAAQVRAYAEEHQMSMLEAKRALCPPPPPLTEQRVREIVLEELQDLERRYHKLFGVSHGRD